MPFDKTIVKISISIGTAICSDQKLRPVKIWCIHRCKLNLYRPLGKHTLIHAFRRLPSFLFALCILHTLLSVHHTHTGSRTSPCKWFYRCFRSFSRILLCSLFLLLFKHILLHSLRIISRRLTLYKMNGIHRTIRQTVSQPVAIIISHQLCFPIYHRNSPLMAGLCTSSTPITFLLIYLNNSTNHIPLYPPIRKICIPLTLPAYFSLQPHSILLL